MLKFQRKPYDYIEDNYPMPMIVHVEENVPINNRKIQSKIFFSLSNEFENKNNQF